MYRVRKIYSSVDLKNKQTPSPPPTFIIVQ